MTCGVSWWQAWWRGGSRAGRRDRDPSGSPPAALAVNATPPRPSHHTHTHAPSPPGHPTRAARAQKGDAATKLAISDLNSPAIYVYDVASGSEEPVATLAALHSAPVTVMRYNAPANTVISSDSKGVWVMWGV